MINLRGLIVSGASLLALIVTAPTTCVSAQYVQDHQHLYFDPLDYTISSQALTVVPPPENETKNEYAFVSGFKPQDILERRYTRPLIAKLEPNKPFANAFDLDWHKTYYFPEEINNQTPKQINLYARDIHHVGYGNVDGYIICGKVTESIGGSQESDLGSFLLLTDLNGIPTMFKKYKSIKELNSVVPTKGEENPQGFVAVGTAFSGGREKAAYLSVDIDLSPVCHTTTEGTFGDSTTTSAMESKFKKVIQYGQDDFAMVGYTSNDPTNCQTRDTDILVSLKTYKCEKLRSFHYGQATSTDDNGNLIAYKDEFGMSLAEAKPGKGKGLFITGLVKETDYSCTTSYPPTYTDGFIMRLNKKFNLKYFQRFDYDNDTDVGLAVTQSRNRIWVSGETTTSFLVCCATVPKKRDIFLLEFKKKGSLENSHVYGGPEADGGLKPGNLDLESSQEGYPIILGNTQNFFASNQQSAYLIEHYMSTTTLCNRKDKEPSLEKYPAERTKNKDKERDTEAETMELVAKDVRLDEKVPCVKTK